MAQQTQTIIAELARYWYILALNSRSQEIKESRVKISSQFIALLPEGEIKEKTLDSIYESAYQYAYDC